MLIKTGHSCDLDDQRHIEGLLQILGEKEGNKVTHVQRVRRGTATLPRAHEKREAREKDGIEYEFGRG